MMSYLSLVPISARVHKRQSRMTRICIILAVVSRDFYLFPCLRCGRTADHGHAQQARRLAIALQNMTEDKSGADHRRPDVKYSSWFDAVNADADSGYYIRWGKPPCSTALRRPHRGYHGLPAGGLVPADRKKEVAVSADAKRTARRAARRQHCSEHARGRSEPYGIRIF